MTSQEDNDRTALIMIADKYHGNDRVHILKTAIVGDSEEIKGLLYEIGEKQEGVQNEML